MPGAHYGGGAVVCPLTVRVCLRVCVFVYVFMHVTGLAKIGVRGWEMRGGGETLLQHRSPKNMR